MEINPKVSVITPIYNVEKYIERCARSLFDQTFDDVEYIFVNDCTRDRSIKILEEVIDEYPEKKSQTTIIDHKSNLGVAAARNSGLKIAHGEYVLQVDSDDWGEPTMVEELYLKAKENDSDIVWSDFYVDYPNDLNNSICRKQDVQENPSIFINAILTGKLHGGSCNKLVKRSLCLVHNIHFPVGVNMCEDEVFIVLCLIHAQKITYCPRALYHYIQHVGSITATRTRKSFESEFKAVKILSECIPQELYRESLIIHRAKIKADMFFSGLFSNEEFLSCYPESNAVMVKKQKGKTNKVAIWLALRKHFLIARMVLLFGQTYFKFKQSIL